MNHPATSWTIPIGDSRLNRQARLAQLDHHNTELIRRIEQETSTSDGPIATMRGATLPGDERRLRGIPAIGRGVTGAIPGTRPGSRLR